ncbi:MAG TPA: cyclic nucleotide-binding domain-containing protein [Gaiellaceae bacterium]|nr:cyclic nucleotide-binding domain-containing protein [Gaiellaceae bacterium]
MRRLKEVPLFSGCSKRELEEIAAVADELVFPAGRTLIEQGAAGREFIVVLDGDVEVRRDGNLLPRGDASYFGEVALLTGAPRNATVTTTTQVDALVITARAFDHLVANSQTIRRKVIASLASRLPPD